MTNPQDIDKAFYEICTPEWYLSHGLGFGVKAAFIEGAGWAAALRAVQEPVAQDLAALVRQFAYALRKAAPQHTLPDRAMSFLKARGLQGSVLRAASEQQALDGLERAAQWVEKRRDDYDIEFGSTDPETGTREYPGNGNEFVFELTEIADGIRALATPPPPGAASPGVPARSQNGFTTTDPTPAHCPMKCATMADCSGVCNFTEPAESCTWQEDDGAWKTSCGHAFSIEAGTPTENGMRWCCYCGRSLTQGAPSE